MELAEKVKLTALIRDNNLINFIVAWRPLLDFLKGKEKNVVLALRIRFDMT